MDNTCYCASCHVKFKKRWEDKYQIGTYEWDMDCPKCESSYDVYQKSKNQNICSQIIDDVFEQSGNLLFKMKSGDIYELATTIHQGIAITKKKKS